MAAYRDADNASTDSDKIITPARRKRPAITNEPDMSEDSDEIRGLTPRMRKRAKNRDSDIISISDETESSEDVVTPVNRRGRLQRPSLTGQELNSDIIPARRERPAATNELAMREESDVIRDLTSRVRKRAENRNSDTISVPHGMESSEDDVTSNVRKRRLRRAPVTTEERDSENEDESRKDLREDLEDLKETGIFCPNSSCEDQGI